MKYLILLGIVGIIVRPFILNSIRKNDRARRKAKVSSSYLEEFLLAFLLIAAMISYLPVHLIHVLIWLVLLTGLSGYEIFQTYKAHFNKSHFSH